MGMFSTLNYLAVFRGVVLTGTHVVAWLASGSTAPPEVRTCLISPRASVRQPQPGGRGGGLRRGAGWCAYPVASSAMRLSRSAV